MAGKFYTKKSGLFWKFGKILAVPWESGAKQLVIFMVSAFYLHDQ